MKPHAVNVGRARVGVGVCVFVCVCVGRGVQYGMLASPANRQVKAISLHHRNEVDKTKSLGSTDFVEVFYSALTGRATIHCLFARLHPHKSLFIW